MTDVKDDGGPAFPCTRKIDNWSTDPLATPKEVKCDGLSLRDYFAAAALEGIVKNKDALHLLNGEPEYPWHENVTLTAYMLADAMLEARKK